MNTFDPRTREVCMNLFQDFVPLIPGKFCKFIHIDLLHL